MGKHGQESAGDVLHRPGVSEAETTISDPSFSRPRAERK